MSSRPAKRAKVEVEASPDPSSARTSDSSESNHGGVDWLETHRVPEMTGAEVYYVSRFVERDVARYQPTLKVYGKAVVQSRKIAAYSTDPKMTLKYSGQVVDMHYEYPPCLRRIQNQVESRLGVTFNHVMLNYYEDGSVYIGRHRDNIENRVIAAVSLGAERSFIMTPDAKKTSKKTDKKRWTLEHGSLLVMQGDTQKNWKHEIPKEPKVLQGRISLTFRQLY